MSSETQRLGGPPTRRAAEHTYFVGRRLFEAAEIYGVTATDVERLGSGRRKGDSSLDWHGSEPAKLELSRVLINRVIENSSQSSRRGRLRPPFRRTAQRSTNA